MNLREFKQRIDECEKRLMRGYLNVFNDRVYLGVCEVLSQVMPNDVSNKSYDKLELDWNQQATNDFAVFEPEHNMEPWWLGDNTDRGGKENRARRVDFLRNFEQWAITFKTYKNYGKMI